MQDLYFACASDSAYTAYTCIWSVCVYAVYFTFVSDFVSVCVRANVHLHIQSIVHGSARVRARARARARRGSACESVMEWVCHRVGVR